MKILSFTILILLTNLVFGHNIINEMKYVDSALKVTRLFDDKNEYKKLKINIDKEIKFDSIHGGHEGAFLIIRTDTNRASFLNLYFDAQDKITVMMDADVDIKKDGTFIIGDHGGPIERIDDSIKNLLKCVPNLFLLDIEVKPNIILKMKENYLTDKQIKILKYIFETYSTYPHGRDEMDAENWSIYCKSTKNLKSNLNQDVTEIFAIYKMPIGVRGNGGIFGTFSMENDNKINPILFAGINTEDKTNRKLEVFEDRDTPRIGNLKEINKELKIIKDINPVKIQITRKVNRQIILKPLK